MEIDKNKKEGNKDSGKKKIEKSVDEKKNDLEENNNYESLNDFKPRKWLLIILILIAIAISVVLINKGIEIYKEKKKELNSVDIFNSFDSHISPDFFNSDFEFNKGIQSEDSTRDLLDDVITSNKKNKEHLIVVVFNDYNTSDINEIEKIKNELTPNRQYDISLDYDENKYVNKITIVGKIDRDSMELKRFNNVLEMFAGTRNGISISPLLDKVISNNKTNKEHLLSVVYGSHNTTNPDEIVLIKKELDDWHDYEVSLDYNDEGYANKVTIK